jgi:hypothetical protein
MYKGNTNKNSTIRTGSKEKYFRHLDNFIIVSPTNPAA